MLENFVLFHVRSSPWTLGGVFLVLSGTLLVMCACFLPIMIKYVGATRDMSTEEAQTRAVFGADTHDSVRRIVWAGPAVGKRWEYSFTIGSLRDLRERGDHLAFWVLPGYLILFLLVFVLFGLGCTLLTGARIFLAFSGAGILLITLSLFMMWAAVYTRFE